MSFNLNESKTYINTKLTDLGRRQLSMGRLVFSKAIISDREIDYGIDRTEYYDILNNRILSPADDNPGIDIRNLDGTGALGINSQNFTVAKVFTTGITGPTQFVSARTDGSYVVAETYSLLKKQVPYASQTWNTNQITFNSTPGPTPGDFIFIPWIAPQYPSASVLNFNNVNYSALFYKVISGSSTTFTVDRKIPKFSTSVAHSAQVYYYPQGGIEDYYASGTTQNTPLWNMNIVRTKSVAGTDDTSGLISGYTRYGSLNYAGTKHYFGFGNETPTVGFIHHTNNNSGNTAGEQLIEKTVRITTPFVMWHHANAVNGQASGISAVFHDAAGPTEYDTIAKTTFRYLCDNANSLSAGTIVGKVYHKLKMIVITDQELLNALSYKSNRNYTYPEPIVSLGTTPKYPSSTLNSTGLCKSDYTYFVTYLPESDAYGANTSLGLPDAIHCGYIKKIEGKNDINGKPHYLNLSFPSNSFPFMRDDTGISGFSGTGWNAQTVQILISEQPTNLNYDIGNVPPTSWKRVIGNGIYDAANDSTNTIDPNNLNNHTFVISLQDYNSGSTYVINSAMTMSQTSMNFGSESFFFGNVEAKTLRTTYKSVITITTSPNQLISSTNETFDEYLDENIYISEVALLDNNNQVVAIGKPTYPIKKEYGKPFYFQLEMDF